MRDSSDSPDPLIGRQIRDLRIVERIGQGGMGAVYKAEHVLLHEPRALKVMRTELFNSVPNAVERFEREARIAVRLRHPNLVLIYDFFVEADHHYLVMEYVTGTSLAAFLREHGALSVEGTCRIGIQCCAGLAHAHEMGIIHRDLSPENIMLATSDAGFSVKIIDFGVARAAFSTRGQGLMKEADRTLTGANEFIGKPRYASPEQAGALRRGETLDHRSDIYTLGLILYEMATGREPFDADTPFDYLSHHVHTPPTPPTQLVPDLAIPSALENVILRCLAKNRAERYANARELSAALELALRTVDARAARAKTRRVRRAASRRTTRVALIAVSAALAAVAIGAGALWWSGREAPTPEVHEPALEPPEPVVLATPAPVPIPEPVATPELAVAPEPIPVDEPIALPTPAPAPTPEPARAEPTPKPVAKAQPVAPKPKPKPEVRAKPRPEPKPEPAKPSTAGFANEAEMKRAFDAALEYERSHPKPAAIARWKEFRGRAPSRGLDEEAKRRITALTLGNLPGL